VLLSEHWFKKSFSIWGIIYVLQSYYVRKSLQFLCEWIAAIGGHIVFKSLPYIFTVLILPILGSSWVGPSNCVNSSGNCVWPLTVSVIARLLQYFAWQSERLTPEGWRPAALRLTGRGLLKAPLVHLPARAAIKPPLILSPDERESGQAVAFRVAEVLQGEAWVVLRHTDTPSSPWLHLGSREHL